MKGQNDKLTTSPPNSFLFDFFQLSFTPKVVSNFFLGAVRETIDYREKNQVKRNDFMQLLIQLKNKGKIDDVDDLKNEKETKTESKSCNFLLSFSSVFTKVVFSRPRFEFHVWGSCGPGIRVLRSRVRNILNHNAVRLVWVGPKSRHSRENSLRDQKGPWSTQRWIDLRSYF